MFAQLTSHPVIQHPCSLLVEAVTMDICPLQTFHFVQIQQLLFSVLVLIAGWKTNHLLPLAKTESEVRPHALDDKRPSCLTRLVLCAIFRPRSDILIKHAERKLCFARSACFCAAGFSTSVDTRLTEPPLEMQNTQTARTVRAFTGVPSLLNICRF